MDVPPLLLRRVVMDNVRITEANLTYVEVVEACGEWFVRVVEQGNETTTSFELETFAMAFADGQRIRLGLERITRI
jgi:hypothetical protein